MSWMLVVGKVYHCAECGSSLQVEYEGGAVMTQVSDMVIEEQSGLLDEFNQPNCSPEVDGYYLQEIIVCEKCFVKKEYDGTHASHMMELLSDVDKVADDLIGQVRASCEYPTLEDLKDFIGVEIFNDLSSKSMLPARKKRKLNETFQSWHCADEFLARLITREIQKLPKPLPDVPLKKFAAQLSEENLTVFTPKEVWVAENTNPFIQSEHTIRIPTSTTPKMVVYIEGVIDVKFFKSCKLLGTKALLDLFDDDRPKLRETFKQMAQRHFMDELSVSL